MKKEITKSENKVKEYNVKIKMSQADLERLSLLCGESGITVSELISTFIGDLTRGTYYSGSDEGMLADEWFNRHGFSWMNDDSILVHLLVKYGTVEAVSDFLDAFDDRRDDEIDMFLDGYRRDIYGVSETDIQATRDWLTETISLALSVENGTS